MRKIFLSVLFVMAAVLVQAGTMSFVTYLSQPVGVFGSVDVLSNENDAATIFFLNFCDEHIGGTIETNSLYAKSLTLKRDTQLMTPLENNVEKLISKHLTLQKISFLDEEEPILTGGTLTVSGTLESAKHLHLITSGELVLKNTTAYSFDAASFSKLTIEEDGVQKVVFEEPAKASDNNLKTTAFKWERIGILHPTEYVLFNDD